MKITVGHYDLLVKKRDAMNLYRKQFFLFLGLSVKRIIQILNYFRKHQNSEHKCVT